MKCQLRWGLAAFLAASIVAMGGNIGFANVNWAHTYEGDVLPTAASPVWSEPGGPLDSKSSDGDLLTISYGVTDPNAYYNLWAGTFWDGDSPTGSTIEMRLKQVSGASRFELGMGSAGAFVPLFSTSLFGMAQNDTDLDPAGGDSVSLDMTDFHTFRFVVNGQSSGARTTDVYIDGSTTAAFTNTSYTVGGGNRMLFPDGATLALDGEVVYDYIRWTNSEATAPIPEPSSLVMMLLGCGLAALIRGSWRRRR